MNKEISFFEAMIELQKGAKISSITSPHSIYYYENGELVVEILGQGCSYKCELIECKGKFIIIEKAPKIGVWKDFAAYDILEIVSVDTEGWESGIGNRLIKVGVSSCSAGYIVYRNGSVSKIPFNPDWTFKFIKNIKDEIFN